MQAHIASFQTIAALLATTATPIAKASNQLQSITARVVAAFLPDELELRDADPVPVLDSADAVEPCWPVLACAEPVDDVGTAVVN